ncbi:MAG: hypothetical protein U0U66_03170 [Cytophagaceae bacterium]
MYKIKQVEVDLYRTEPKDGCLQLYKMKDYKDIDTLNHYVVGLRFILDYYSLTTESYWENNKSPSGYVGHNDSIVFIDIYSLNDNKLDLSRNSSRLFHSQEIDLRNGHPSSDGCLVAQNYNSMAEIISYYNKNKRTYILNQMKSLHLFGISKSDVISIKHYGLHCIYDTKMCE